MFGAPDLPERRPAPAPKPTRKPGVGDHVCGPAGYLGLIVEARPGGLVTVARRHASGRSGVIEHDVLVDGLRLAVPIPLAFDEEVDREWRRGKLW